MRILALCSLFLLAETALTQQPVRVTVAHPIARDASQVEFTGTMEPARSIEVRTSLTSKVTKLFFKQGDRVAPGDLLAELDPGPVEARVRQSEQAVARADTEVKRAQKRLAVAEQLAKLDAKALADLRAEELGKFQTVADKARTAFQNQALKNTYWKSQAEFRTARDVLDQTLVLFKTRPPGSDPLAQVQRLQQALSRLPSGPVPLDKDCAAELANMTEILDKMVLCCRTSTPQGRQALKAEAALAETVLKTVQEGRDRTRQELSLTKISAPASLDKTGGLVRWHVKVGDSVVGAEWSATLLARIVQVNAVKVTFAIDEATYLSYQEMVKHKEQASIPIELVCKEENRFSLSGRIEFVDNRLDPKKGQAVVHAVFENAKDDLTEAALSVDKKRHAVRVRLTQGESRKVVLVPRQVILANPDGSRQALVVKDRKLEVRTVKLGGELGGMQIVASGLTPEDLVIVGSDRRVFKGQDLTPEDFASDVRLLRSHPGTAVEPVLTVLPKLAE